MKIPETHYARSADGLKLAYQQWGDGPRLLLVPALVSNVELDWEHEFNRGRANTSDDTCASSSSTSAEWACRTVLNGHRPWTNASRTSSA